FVIPSREARHGRLYVWCRKNTPGAIHLFGDVYYKTITVTNAAQSTNSSIIDKNSKIPELRTYTFSYLHHLLKIQEGLGFRVATLVNVEFYLTLMNQIRNAIKNGIL
ncbi:tRNA-guanine transglycosylase, partial [Candidatus Falkowbacteria bacterium]|nr:tRNA-guanine transglycosylase [Candidatus Falkowbacteria bacterium]